MAGMIEVAKATVTIIPNMSGSQKEITKGLTGVTTSASSAAGKASGAEFLTSMGDTMSKAGKTMTKTVSLPLLALGTYATKSAIDFESAFTGVVKTVDGTDEQLSNIREGILGLSKNTASSAIDIAAVAEAAGQLGIATDDVLDFTKVMVMLGDTTNLSADSAASSLAKFANITGTSSKNYGRLGSTIVDLGNNMATTEADIVNMATNLASAGRLAGLTEPEILALSASMSSVGIQAEAGGTAMTQTLSNIESAVAGGGEKLDQFAHVAGMDAKSFATAWKTKPVEALTAFIKGLGSLDEQGESATLTLDAMGLSGIRQSNMLKSLGLASDLLTDSLGIANGAWESNTALTDEASKKYQTTEAKIAQARATLAQTAITIGETLVPMITTALETLTPIIEGIGTAWSNLDPGMQSFIVKAALVAIVAGPIVTVLGSIFSGVGKIISPIARLAGGIGSLAGKAGGAVASLSGCATSLSQMAGQALLLVALGAAVYIVANAMSILVDAAIRLAEAGPAASWALLELAGVGVAVAGALALIGSVSTVSALGLIALGGAVALVSAGISAIVWSISTVIDSLTNFTNQLPLISQYGASAAVRMVLLGTSFASMGSNAWQCAAALVAMGGAAGTAFLGMSGSALSVGALDLAIVGLTAAASGSLLSLLAFKVALDGVNSKLTDVKTSADDAGTSMSGLISMADSIDSAITGVLDSIGGFVTDLINSVSNAAPDGKTAGTNLGSAVATGISDGMKNIETDTKTTMTSVSTAITNQKTTFQTAGKTIGSAVVTGVKDGMSTLQTSATTIMTQTTTALTSALSSLQAKFSSTRFYFNSYIALPHFYMYGNFDAKTRQVPSVGVNWYAKAAEQGALFTNPTLIGVGDAAQGELLIGEKTLFNMIMKAVRGGGQNIVMNVYGAEGQNVNELANIVMKKMQHQIDKKEAAFA